MVSNPCPRDGACAPAVLLALLLTKAGAVEPNPGPTYTRTVWIYDPCSKEIYTIKQTSIKCNTEDHWVHLRCASLTLKQHMDLPSTYNIQHRLIKYQQHKRSTHTLNTHTQHTHSTHTKIHHKPTHKPTHNHITPFDTNSATTQTKNTHANTTHDSIV